MWKVAFLIYAMIKSGKKKKVPERAEAMSAWFSDSAGTFRIFFTLLHSVEAPSKIFTLLCSNLTKHNK